MIAELGHFSFILSGIIALSGVVIGAIDLRGKPKINSLASVMAIFIFLFCLLAFLSLAYSFLTDDFSIAYVAANSNTQLPTFFKFSAIWGAHEGSLLLWIMVLAFWLSLFAITAKNKIDIKDYSLILIILKILYFAFFAFSEFTSNSFERIIPLTPVEGADLNPILQDFGLAVHPPTLYFGYIGLAVIFSWALSALIQKKSNQKTIEYMHFWILVPFIFLTIGIALGSWWAYYELGWGGWWFWDPVENASFMPWLACIALLHSFVLLKNKGLFINWNLFLAILAFILSILGGFLVRSGILTSVHSFASSPERGIFLLIIFLSIVLLSTFLFITRSIETNKSMNFKLFSKETLVLLNSLFFVVAVFSILLGTLYPLFLEIIMDYKISVGTPYFNAIFVPLMAVALFFMALSPSLNWTNTQINKKELIFNLVASLILGFLASLLVVQSWSLPIFTVSFLASLNFLPLAKYVFSYLKKSKKIQLATFAMPISHFGAIVLALGVIFTTYLSKEIDKSVKIGDKVIMDDYVFLIKNIQPFQGSNFVADMTTIELYKNNELLSVLQPQKRFYKVRNSITTEAAIDAGFFADIFVSMANYNESDKSWTMKFHYKAYVRWVWLGAIIIALGSLLACFRKRKVYA